jgi:hypothetical protein
VDRRGSFINSNISLNKSSIIQRDVTGITKRDIGAIKVLISLQLTLISLINYGHVITGNTVNLIKKYFLPPLTLYNYLSLTFFFIRSNKRLK